MAGLKAPLLVVWQACGRDEGGRRREGAGGRCLGGQLGGAPMGGRAWGEAPWGCSFLASVSVAVPC
jgi:hypothetical protein